MSFSLHYPQPNWLLLKAMYIATWLLCFDNLSEKTLWIFGKLPSKFICSHLSLTQDVIANMRTTLESFSQSFQEISSQWWLSSTLALTHMLELSAQTFIQSQSQLLLRTIANSLEWWWSICECDCQERHGILQPDKNPISTLSWFSQSRWAKSSWFICLVHRIMSDSRG